MSTENGATLVEEQRLLTHMMSYVYNCVVTDVHEKKEINR